MVIPDSGFTYSAEKINMDITVVSDWVEATIFFKEEELSQSDVSDILIENQLCKGDEIAQQIVDAAWNELKRRSRWTRNTGLLSFEDQWVRKGRDWQGSPAHAFCLLLSLAPKYSWWTNEFGRDYNEQGELFEQVTKFSLETQFDDEWTVIPTGWSRANPAGLSSVVEEISEHIYEAPRSMPLWVSSNAKEIGLDLLCIRKFSDNRAGIPIYMLQCASGNDWTDKVHTPNLNRWKKIIDFYSFPVKGLAIPFCIDDDLFLSNTLDIEGLFLERCRLLCAESVNPNWLPQELVDRLIAWVNPRIEGLLNRSG